jgi:hypothetical protein
MSTSHVLAMYISHILAWSVSQAPIRWVYLSTSDYLKLTTTTTNTTEYM